VLGEKAYDVILEIENALKKIKEEEFNSQNINKALSKVLVKSAKKMGITNEQVYGIMRVAVTGERRAIA